MSTDPSRRPSPLTILLLLAAGIVGGVVAAAALLLVGAVDDGTSQTTTVVRTVIEPSSDGAGADASINVVQRVYRTAAPSVVGISAEISQPTVTPFGPQTQRGTATGSGFVIDDKGHIVTNAHVVEGAERITVSLGDGDPVPARITGTATSVDIAMLEVNPDRVFAPPLPLGDSGTVQVGDQVVAIGNPFGLDRTVTTGIVSALQREIQAPNDFTITDVIQTDAAINPGNSGGPLLDVRGRVIGVNTQIVTRSGGSEGIGFAVPAATVKRVAQEIVRTGRARLPLLGVTGADLTPELAAQLGLPRGQRGVLLSAVLPGGPAARAGLRAGDVIVAIGGQSVSDNGDLNEAITPRAPGDSVAVSILRDGEDRELTVRLGARPG